MRGKELGIMFSRTCTSTPILHTLLVCFFLIFLHGFPTSKFSFHFSDFLNASQQQNDNALRLQVSTIISLSMQSWGNQSNQWTCVFLLLYRTGVLCREECAWCMWKFWMNNHKATLQVLLACTLKKDDWMEQGLPRMRLKNQCVQFLARWCGNVCDNVGLEHSWMLIRQDGCYYGCW